MNAIQLAKEFRAISKAAKELAKKLKPAAENNQDATPAQRSKLKDLVKRLGKADQAARKLARANLERRIKDLGENIDALQAALTISGLTQKTRKKLRARLRNLRAQRSRLNAQKGTDFAGLISKARAKELTRLLERAKVEVKRKQKAAAAIETTMDIAEIAIAVGGKVLSPP